MDYFNPQLPRLAPRFSRFAIYIGYLYLQGDKIYISTSIIAPRDYAGYAYLRGVFLRILSCRYDWKCECYGA